MGDCRLLRVNILGLVGMVSREFRSIVVLVGRIFLGVCDSENEDR